MVLGGQWSRRSGSWKSRSGSVRGGVGKREMDGNSISTATTKGRELGSVRC